MRKVVIIGAGHVGSHCGYALAHSGVASEIVLVDVDKDKAHAQALDIADSVSFCERETVVRDLWSQEITQMRRDPILSSSLPESLESRDRQDLIC